MRKVWKSLALGLVVVFALAGTAMGADQVRDRDRLKDGSCQVAAGQIRDRLKDGSCQVAGDLLRTRDRAKDGSCQVAAGQIRGRDRLKDGSCLDA
jgi:hypothetical protein